MIIVVEDTLKSRFSFMSARSCKVKAETLPSTTIASPTMFQKVLKTHQHLLRLRIPMLLGLSLAYMACRKRWLLLVANIAKYYLKLNQQSQHLNYRKVPNQAWKSYTIKFSSAEVLNRL